jgi:hypothetical protein
MIHLLPIGDHKKSMEYAIHVCTATTYDYASDEHEVVVGQLLLVISQGGDFAFTLYLFLFCASGISVTVSRWQFINHCNFVTILKI